MNSDTLIDRLRVKATQLLVAADQIATAGYKTELPPAVFDASLNALEPPKLGVVGTSPFESSRFVEISVPDLVPVGKDVYQHFLGKGYEAEITSVNNKDAVVITITRGGMLMWCLGLRTAMSISIARDGNGVRVTASVGIFGQSVVPAMIAVFLFWPLLIPVVWGAIKSSEVDDEALECVGKSLEDHKAVAGT